MISPWVMKRASESHVVLRARNGCPQRREILEQFMSNAGTVRSYDVLTPLVLSVVLSLWGDLSPIKRQRCYLFLCVLWANKERASLQVAHLLNCFLSMNSQSYNHVKFFIWIYLSWLKPSSNDNVQLSVSCMIFFLVHIFASKKYMVNTCGNKGIM